MIKSLRAKHIRRSALAGVLGLAVVAAFAQGAARAADDDDDPNSIWNLDKRFIDSVARGIGLKSPNENPIEYRERSPLVVPPTRNLPPPEAAGNNRNAAWPVDPDQKRREATAERKKTRANYNCDDDCQMRAISRSELDPPGASAGRTPKSGGSENDGSESIEGRNMQPSELGFTGGLFSWGNFWGSKKEERATFDREPPRSSLTAPPTGYQTPSAAQPYGLSKEKVRQTVTPLDPAAGSLGN